MKNFFIIAFLLIAGNTFAQDYFNTDTTYVMNGKKYHLSTRDLGEDQDFILYKVTCGNKKILHSKKEKGGSSGWDLIDFNKDGYPDILISYMGNNYSAEIYLFNPTADKYVEVKDFIKFPEAIQLKSNPNYYYSYHRAGCADMNWVSDLFTIKNYKAIHLGEIYGQGCDYEDDGSPKIDISKVINNDGEKTQLIKTIPYSDEVIQNRDKWKFIEKYWNENYKLFK